MPKIVLLLFSLLLWIPASLADQKDLPPDIQQKLNAIGTATDRIDFLTDYVNTNYIQKKSITNELALALLNQAENNISKSTDALQQYAVYNLLFTVHTALNNNRKASAYQKKAAMLNIQMGDLKQQELDQKNQTIAKQEGAIARQEGAIDQLEQENEEQGKILEETTLLLSMEKMERENKEAQLKAIQQEQAIRELLLQRERTMNTVYILLFLLFLVISVTAVIMFLKNKKFSRKLEEQNILLAHEKKRSDDLLLNILPHELAEELKLNGHSDARSHDAVTVMFTDFVDFTSISEKMSPQSLVHEIDYCFKAFDQIIAKYGIEKIKTVGDAYLCASGLPAADNLHAVNILEAALEIRDFMVRLKEDRDASGKLAFQIRIGVHSGPLVAGIVGIKKFVYDIWGDTVNIASRMETTSEPGKINVSEDTYNLSKDKFRFIHRGKVEAKNKGFIEMYYVEKKVVEVPELV